MSEPPRTVNVQRCMFDGCRRKLGLLPFHCRCEMDFCGHHRAAEVHNCTFDYRTEAKKELLKFMSSPIVSAKVGII